MTNSEEQIISLKDLISLIRAHYEGDEDNFKEISRKVADELARRGESQLESYIHVLTGDMRDVWVPM